MLNPIMEVMTANNFFMLYPQVFKPKTALYLSATVGPVCFAIAFA